MDTVFRTKHYVYYIYHNSLSRYSKDWNIKRTMGRNKTDNSFEASFQHFSGEHKVPIELKRGDILEFTIESQVENSNGYIGDIKWLVSFKRKKII